MNSEETLAALKKRGSSVIEYNGISLEVREPLIGEAALINLEKTQLIREAKLVSNNVFAPTDGKRIFQSEKDVLELPLTACVLIELVKAEVNKLTGWKEEPKVATNVVTGLQVPENA